MSPFLAFCLLAGLAATPPTLPLAHTVPEPPVAPGASALALAEEASQVGGAPHELLLTWLEPPGRLRFARWAGDHWFAPVTLAEAVAPPAPGDEAAFTAFETHGVRRTLLARTGEQLQRSGDGGRTWSRWPSPSVPFGVFAPGEEGAFVFWLRPGTGAAATVLATRVLAGETVVAADALAGSPLAAVMTWDGPLLLYRTLGGELAAVRRENAHWTAPAVVLPAAAGGPPRVAALERRVVAAWVAGAGSAATVRVAFSSDAGRSFGPTRTASRPGETPADPAGLAVALDDAGQALVAWEVVGGPGRAPLVLVRLAADGRRSEALPFGTGERLGGSPRLVRAGSEIALAWLEGSPARARVAAVALASLPEVGPEPAVPRVAGPVHPGRGRVGEEAPGNLAVAVLSGGRAALAALRGKPVLLNLWATWCLPCLAEMPQLTRLAERYRALDLTVVGLNVDRADLEPRVREMVAERKMSFTIWLDPENRLYRALAVETLPTTLVLDREGRIVYRREEGIDADDPELNQAIVRAGRPASGGASE